MRRIPFKMTYNLREIGGIAISLHHQTKYRTILRSDALLNLTDQEIEFLQNYGIKNIVDLRNDYEVNKRPNQLANNPNFNYTHFPFLNEDKRKEGAKHFFDRDLLDIYQDVIDNHTQLGLVFKFLANCEGGTIIHCSAGKDRTGIVVMILLLLVGVGKLDIVTDYEVSFTNLLPRDNERGISLNIMQSNRETALGFIDKFLEKHSVLEFLRMIGLSDSEIGKLKSKLIENV